MKLKVQVMKMKLRISKTIGDLFEMTPHGDHDFDVYVNYNGSDVVVISSADMIHHLEYSYNEWRMFTRGDTLAAEYSYLVYCFGEYCKQMQNSLNKIYAALMATYDSTANFARHETVAYQNVHSHAFGKSAVNDTIDMESKTEYNSTVADDIKTYDSVTVDDAQSTSKTGNDTTTINGKQITQTTGTDTTTDTRLPSNNQRDITGLQRSNAAENINAEIDMRIRRDFTDIVLQGFADTYLFLSAGV